MSLQYFAGARFHFKSAYAQANSYQLVASLSRSQITALPVTFQRPGPAHGGTVAAGRAAADGMARPLRAATVTGDAGLAVPPIPR